jgi:16S rRNA (guanine527-N7)-methyltransferase
VAEHPIQTVLDIGTGAGFPGFPAAIVQSDWQVTLLDATQKKVRFLTMAAESLGLEQC